MINLKVFLRELLDKYLTQKLLVIENEAARIIQKYARMYAARRHFLRLRKSVLILQRCFRRFIYM